MRASRRSVLAVDDLGHHDAVAERHAVADVQVGEQALVVDVDHLGGGAARCRG